MEKIKKSNEEWKKLLTPEQYRVMREKKTELPFTGEYWDYHEKGVYYCSACYAALFSSDTKFDSGSGWPSFYAPVEEGNMHMHHDYRHGMKRIEVTCTQCGAHLGHVFKDGPEPSGLRYCINSISLVFSKEDLEKESL